MSDDVDRHHRRGLDGRAALVTGGSRGIGRAICERLAADGASVGVNYHVAEQRSEAEEVVDAITGAGGQAVCIQADVSDSSQVRAAVDQMVDAFGGLTILVNNAAVTKVHRSWTEITEQSWDQVMSVNAKSGFLCAQAVHPHMAAAGWGRVINISSVTFLLGRADLVHYVASKGALVGFTRSLARAVGADGITVNSVSPGAIQTPMELEIAGDRQDELLSELKALQAIPRRGVAEDVAGAVSFLASEDASFISGQLLNVDGGWAMH